MCPQADHDFGQGRYFDLLSIHGGPNCFTIELRVFNCPAQAYRPDFRDQIFIRYRPCAIVVNARVIDIFNKIILALFKSGNLFPNAVL